MYFITDTPSAIKEIQKYLRELYIEDSIIPSGVYDDKTKELVERFQREHGLSASGSVDVDTFEMIYEEYLRESDKNTLQRENPELTFPITRGYGGVEMHRINEVLKESLEYYRLPGIARSGMYFSDDTGISIKEMQRILRIKQSDYIDEEFYIRLMDDHHSQRIIIETIKKGE